MKLLQAFGQFAGQAAAEVPIEFEFITSTTFSAVSSVSVDNCFSADYDEYLILRSFSGTQPTYAVDLRLRASGVDASGSDYLQQYLTANNTSVAGARPSAKTQAPYALGYIYSSAMGSTITTIQYPYSAQPTAINGENDYDIPTGIYWNNFFTTHSLSTSYDGFTAVPALGTITGSIYVYGWRK